MSKLALAAGRVLLVLATIAAGTTAGLYVYDRWVATKA